MCLQTLPCAAEWRPGPTDACRLTPEVAAPTTLRGPGCGVFSENLCFSLKISISIIAGNSPLQPRPRWWSSAVSDELLSRIWPGRGRCPRRWRGESPAAWTTRFERATPSASASVFTGCRPERAMVSATAVFFAAADPAPRAGSRSPASFCRAAVAAREPEILHVTHGKPIPLRLPTRDHRRRQGVGTKC